MRVSIITAVYNNRDEIGVCIKSVQSQTYHDIEHIVVDGGSTDGTMEVVRSYSDSISVIVSEKDEGLYDALNKGVCVATGDVVGFLHSDDIYSSLDVIEEVCRQFIDETTDAVYGDLHYVGKNNPETVVRYWRSSVFRRKAIKNGWMPPHPTLFVKQKFFKQLGGFDLNYKIAADYDWMLRFFSLADLNIKYIAKVLVRMRVGGESNKSISNIILKSREDYRAIRQNRAGNVFTLVGKNISKISQFITFL